MAQLTGIFNADFTSFTKACEQGSASLKSFETDANKTAISLDKMADSISGQKIVQQALLATKAVEDIGGAAMLTDKELERMSGLAAEGAEKLAKMGQTVPADMQALADATKNAHTAWGAFVEDFKITDAIEHPLTAATQGMTALANSMGPTAVAAVGVVSAVAAVGSVVFELTEKAAAAGERIQDFSTKTGMSVPAVSMLSKAVVVAGGDMDTMSNALFNLEKRMAENSPEFQKGMEKLQISSQDWKNVGVDGYLQLVADKLEVTGDSSQRAAGLMELFGKQGRDLAPVLTKLHEAEELVSDFTPWTAEQAKQADDFEMRMRSLKIHVEALANGIGKDFIGPADAFIQHAGGMAEALTKVGDSVTGGLITQVGVAREGVRTFGDILQTFNRYLAGTKEGMEGIPSPTDQASSAVERFYNTVTHFSWAGLAKDAIKEVGAAVNVMTGDMGTIPAVAGPAADALKRQADETARLKDETQKHVMTASDQKLLELEMAPAVEAHTQKLKEYADILKEVQKIEGNHAKQAETNYLGLSKAENDYTQQRLVNGGKAADQLMAIDKRLTDEYNKQTMSRSDYENQKLWEAADAQIAAFQKTGATAEQVTQFSNKVYEETALKASQIDYAAGQTITSITSKAVDGVQKMAAAGAAALQTLQGGEKLPGSTTVQEFGQNYILSPTGARVPIGPHGEIPKNFDALYSGKSSFPQFAGGVENFGGGLAIVGERGPELVNLPAGSDVIPNSRMGGGGVSITIHVTQPFGTPEAIARAVADAQVSLMRGQGVRLPYGT
jgi:hypothetical protein